MSWYLPELVDRVRELLGPEYPVTTELPSNQSAWLTVPVFAVAKQSGRPLSDVANEVADKLRAIDGIDVTVTGGFVNVTPTQLDRVLTEASQLSADISDVEAGQTVIIDFSSPNIAKPMSIGHLRSTIIGDALQRLHRSLGARVIGVNHIGDWGTQFGKLLVAYKQAYGDLVPRPELTVQDLLKLYVEFHAAAERDPELDDEARAMFQRLESGDAEVRTLWQSLVEISLHEFQGVYDRLGVTFTEPAKGESFYEDKLQPIIALAREKGVAEESDGALIIRLPNQETPLLLQKNDGTTLYATRDLAAIRYRIETYHPSSILYVVANEQALHFEQLFAAAKLMGIAPESVILEHVKFGLVRLPEGKISTRAGRVVFLDDVLDEAIKRARAVVEEKNPELSDREKDHIADVVGLGALKYFDLSHDRKHDIIFDWDRMLELGGDSGPYLQYTYVRAAQILAKAGRSEQSEQSELSELSLSAPSLHSLSQLNSLIRELARFPLVIERAATDATPHTLAQYLNELATQFSRFYETYPVLKADGDERAIRLTIVSNVANVLKRGLNLLGIDTLEQM